MAVRVSLQEKIKLLKGKEAELSKLNKDDE